jgi:hypothetical protein
MLDDSWLPPGERFDYLQSLLETMRQVMRAIASIGAPGGHLKNQGAGALLTFARDIWKYSNPVDRAALDEGLSYVAGWLASSETSAPPEIIKLRAVVDAISRMIDPFAVDGDRAVDAGGTEPDLGTDIRDMLTEVEEMLKEYEPEELAETGRQQVLQQLRKQLG